MRITTFEEVQRFEELIATNYIVNVCTGCHEWALSTKDGYGQITALINGRRVFYLAHRVRYLLTHGGSLTTTDQIMHSCDNPKCINPDHLIKGNAKLNKEDAMAKGRVTRESKFTDQEVVRMRLLYADGTSISVLQSMFNASSQIVRMIVAGKTYKHLPVIPRPTDFRPLGGSRTLTDVQVRDIKRRLTEGENLTSLGARYGVSPATISSIKTGRTWSHITVEPQIFTAA